MCVKCRSPAVFSFLRLWDTESTVTMTRVWTTLFAGAVNEFSFGGVTSGNEGKGRLIFLRRATQKRSSKGLNFDQRFMSFGEVSKATISRRVIWSCWDEIKNKFVPPMMTATWRAAARQEQRRSQSRRVWDFHEASKSAAWVSLIAPILCFNSRGWIILRGWIT